MFSKIVAALALLSTTACQQPAGGAAQEVDYRPGEAGTVDHALCLLGFRAIPVTEVATGHHLVEAEINGTTGSFVLDTGANVSVVNEAQAERFGLERGAGARGALGTLPVAGARAASMASVDSFVIGEIPIRQDRVVRADLGQLLTALSQATGEDVAGIIGQDVLTEHRAIIDVAGLLLYLMEEDRDPAPVPAEQCAAGEREQGSG
jgi:predicted aspartyl protease